MRKIEEVSEQEAIDAFNGANSKGDIAIKLGINYFNKKISLFIDKIAIKYNLSLDNLYKVDKRRIYQKINKICPVCSKTFETEDGHKREKKTCSYSCSNIFFKDKRHTEEANTKTSESLYSFNQIKNPGKESTKKLVECPVCLSLFKRKQVKQICCGRKCALIKLSSNLEFSEKIRMLIRKRINDGNHKGWAHRNKFARSYAENYVEEILNEMNFFRSKEFEIEHKQHFWFIDFAFLEKKIALEIDGRQHRLPERKASDERKDAWLTANGWTVCRIKWRKPNKEFRDEIENTLKNLLSVE